RVQAVARRQVPLSGALALLDRGLEEADGLAEVTVARVRLAHRAQDVALARVVLDLPGELDGAVEVAHGLLEARLVGQELARERHGQDRAARVARLLG